MDVFEAMGSAVSMRWLKPDPVPDELVERLIWAATRASNPGNVQPWDFVVVRDQATRRDVVQLIAARLTEIRRRATRPAPDDPTQRRMLQGVGYLVDHLDDAPVLIFVCGNNVYPPNAPQEHMMYSATFAAAQNSWSRPGAWDWERPTRPSSSAARRRSKTGLLFHPRRRSA